jgi:hypothetical protein
MAVSLVDEHSEIVLGRGSFFEDDCSEIKVLCHDSFFRG